MTFLVDPKPSFPTGILGGGAAQNKCLIWILIGHYNNSGRTKSNIDKPLA